MSFSLQNYGHWRPYLYHLTARENADNLRSARRLDSASTMLDAAGRTSMSYERRAEITPIDLGRTKVLLRDQSPLYKGNIDFAPGWEFADLLWDLNRRVFFWSGREQGPISYGVRHFERYREDGPVILRVKLASLLEANPQAQPQFCRFNSGSPRAVNGRKSPRGPETFLPADQCQYLPGDVVEVTFIDHVRLSDDTEISTQPNGPWVRFFA